MGDDNSYQHDSDEKVESSPESLYLYALEEKSYHERYRQESDIRRQLVPRGFLLLFMCSFVMTSK